MRYGPREPHVESLIPSTVPVPRNLPRRRGVNPTFYPVVLEDCPEDISDAMAAFLCGHLDSLSHPDIQTLSPIQKTSPDPRPPAGRDWGKGCSSGPLSLLSLVWQVFRTKVLFSHLYKLVMLIICRMFQNSCMCLGESSNTGISFPGAVTRTGTECWVSSPWLLSGRTQQAMAVEVPVVAATPRAGSQIQCVRVWTCKCIMFFHFKYFCFTWVF